jgi:hypothetical protein
MNAVLLASGLALEHWLGQPRGLPEFNADLVRLLGAPESGKSRRPAVPAVDEPQPQAPVSLSACLKIGGFDQARYGELLAMLESAGIGPQQRMFLINQSLGWWVFWPPEYEAGEREKALRAIRAAGVGDAIPIVKGPMAQAYSLGVFATEEQAVTHRNRMRSRGLDKAEHGPRPGVAAKDVHLLCTLRDEAQRERLQSGLPAGVSLVEQTECPAVEAGQTR